MSAVEGAGPLRDRVPDAIKDRQAGEHRRPLRLSDIEAFVGLPYSEADFDCADLVVLVQRELFGQVVHVPNGRPRGVRGALQLGELSRQYAAPVATPEPGDLVLMLERGRPAHVGTYFRLAHEGWVLHTCARSTCSVLHRVRDLAAWGAPIEGWYRWV